MVSFNEAATKGVAAARYGSGSRMDAASRFGEFGAAAGNEQGHWQERSRPDEKQLEILQAWNETSSMERDIKWMFEP